jgi:NAD(P)-dependent dehydrogenase (short-subunit alcohol dehydrogenase family)
MTAARFEDQVALISGTSGIAAATARLALAEGGKVFLVGLNGEEGAAFESGSEGRGGFLEGDLTDPATSGAALDACLARWGRLDALFNVAGISGRRFGDGPVHECTGAGWEATLDNNVKSTFLLSRAALRHFLSLPGHPGGTRGSIVNMSSVLAWAPQADLFATHAYAASKGAIISLTKAMAAYYAPHGIRVNAVAPGLVRTPMSARAQVDPEILSFIQRKQPLPGGMISSEEIAEAALFLMGGASKAITGQILAVDGGWTVS